MPCCLSGVCNDVCGCCSSQIPSDAEITSINKNRSCTDKLMTIIYMCSWAGIIYLLIYCSQHGGDPYKLYYGIDMQGHICGSGVNAGKPYNVMPNPVYYNYTVCVSTCDITNDNTLQNTPMAIIYPSSALGHYCMPNVNAIRNMATNTSITFANVYADASTTAGRIIADLYIAWPCIAASVGICVAVALCFTMVTRYAAGLFVWLCTATIIAAGFLAAYFFYTTSQTETNQTRSNAYKWTGIGLAIADAVFILIIFAMRKRIQIAIEVIKESSIALTDLISLLTFPLIPLILVCAYCVWFIYVTLYLFSAGQLVNDNQPLPYDVTHKLVGFSSSDTLQPNSNIAITSTVTYNWNSTLRWCAAYHIFHALWTIQCIKYFTLTVISGTVADWYFTARDQYNNKIRGISNGGLSYFACTASVYRTLRYHIGTICFGALIIAIIEFARACVAYVERQTRGANGQQPNRLQRAIFCIVQSLLGCIEWCAEKISTNVLIYTSITGDSFCSSMTASFSLLWRNILRVAAINMISSIIVLVGKLTVTAMTIGICAVILTRDVTFSNHLYSSYVPLIIIAILSYSISSLYFSLFSSTIDTIFMCFLLDSEHNNKQGRSMLASISLQHLVGKYADSSEKEGIELQKRRNVKTLNNNDNNDNTSSNSNNIVDHQRIIVVRTSGEHNFNKNDQQQPYTANMGYANTNAPYAV